jgi:hypothetical protein
MKKLILPVFAALTLTLSLSVLADETSSPVPIHRTTAKHRVVKPARKPAAAKKSGSTAAKKPAAPAASAAK